MAHENHLLVADSVRDANMLYAVGLIVRNPIVYLATEGKAFVLAGDLEFNRIRRGAKHCQVHSLSRYQRMLRKEGRPADLSHVIAALVREKRARKLRVPESFPLGLAARLRDLGVKVKVKPDAFFPQREIKEAAEVKKISAALLMAEVGLAEGINVLKNARVSRNRHLLHHNAPLTSEKLRAIINVAVMQAGGIASDTIVAPGAQACDPHEHGSGPLRANEPIVIDVFPRSQKTGYFGDITRTVVKGRANEAVRKLYHTVARAQEIVFRNLRNGSSARDIHEKVQSFFETEGYRTGQKGGRMEGFFHGTGHGLGLELHEAPRLNAHSEDTLNAGNVVTVEPALYFQSLGAVRLEDVALVTDRAPRNLTKFEKVLEV